MYNEGLKWFTPVIRSYCGCGLIPIIELYSIEICSIIKEELIAVHTTGSG